MDKLVEESRVHLRDTSDAMVKGMCLVGGGRGLLCIFIVELVDHK